MPNLPRFPISEWGTKVCSACHREQPISKFWKQKTSVNGYIPRCKSCRYQQIVEHRRANADRYSAYYRSQYRANVVSARAKSREKYTRNPLAGRQATAKWRLANPTTPEQAKARRRRDRDRYADEPEAKRSASRQWRREHPDVYVAATQRRRRRIAQSETHFTPKEWRDLKAQYNHRCLMCRRQEPQIRLTVDHIIPISLGGSNSIDNLQPLCRSCNSKKYRGILDLRPLKQADLLLE